MALCKYISTASSPSSLPTTCFQMYIFSILSLWKAKLLHAWYNRYPFRPLSWLLLRLLRRFGLAQRKYALLIGIEQYRESLRYCTLPGVPGDLRLYKEILTNGLGFHPYDITILTDHETSPLSKLYPNRVNMMREILNLGSSLCSGDLGFFGYTGHAVQLEDFSPSEFDTTDEAIVPANGSNTKESLIVDNDLNQWLVAPLPVGATLLAAFDCCHSATLLDLPFKYAIKRDEQEPGSSQQPTVKTTKAHNTNKGGQGFVLCVSACRDNQKAHELRDIHTGEVFGAMTALLHRQFISRRGIYGPGSSPGMAPPTVQEILVNLRGFLQEKGNKAMVQITSSKELPNPFFGSRVSSEISP
ncbi:hypothetical protein FRC03_011050 [Tulasnella sp. 419]|nr:hypothetical protein FRC03_011050 [Tulasnella sp. 419]